jgi:arylsulfatase A-like enzyme
MQPTNKLVLELPFLAVLSALNVQAGKLPAKPNILLIITDQQSSESIGFNAGHRYLNTPNMDYLAEHGVTFTNAYCANPLCIPSRSSMFTGRYPHELDIQTNETKKIDPVKFPVLGSVLKSNGYETGYVGKWHLPFDIHNKDIHGFGFTENIKGNGVDSLLPGSAIKFLSFKHDKPFFLVVSFINPHNICEWARGQRLPDGETGTPPPPGQCPPMRTNHLPSKNETDIMRVMRSSYQASPMFPVADFTEVKWRQYIWAYFRMIEKTDREIGKILDFLHGSGLDENTLIVFVSDHGDCQGAHGWNQKTVFYEEASKVPFIISHPAFPARKSDFPVQTGIDLLPSLCDFANIPLPENTRGVSLKQLILNMDHPAEREYIVVSDKLVQGETVNGKKPEPEGRMLRNRQFKYWIYNEGEQRETLYDLQKDPGEMVNLAGDPAYSAELNKCRIELSTWAEKNHDPYLKNLIK